MVDTCFFGLTKNKDKKRIGQFSHYFASSQFFHCFTEYNMVLVGDNFSSCDLLIFLVLSETMYLSPPPNHNPHTRSYRGILCMYLWYSKKKEVNVGNPRHKNTVSGLVLCCHDREMLAKSANIWLLGRHVANMLPTFPAKSDVQEAQSIVSSVVGEECLLISPCA